MKHATNLNPLEERMLDALKQARLWFSFWEENEPTAEEVVTALDTAIELAEWCAKPTKRNLKRLQRREKTKA